MSIVVKAFVRCDGCGILSYTVGTGPADAGAARIDAAGAGWTFPRRLLTDGTEGDSRSDVCPTCTPTWRPRPAPNPWTAGGRRRASTRSRP
jgi:hypothetical protein